jgi:hypothetical protein
MGQDLVELITADPRVLLASDAQGAFLTLIGQIGQGKTVESDIEATLGAGCPAGRHSCNSRFKRPDVSAWLSLLSYAALMRSHTKDPIDSTALFTTDDAAGMFRYYAWQLFSPSTANE